MNNIDGMTLNSANREAIFNVYSYIAGKTKPQNGAVFSKIVDSLENDCRAGGWSTNEKQQLEILKKAVESDATLAGAKIGDQIHRPGGLNACTFEYDGQVSVVFRGTGKGEWIDNGEGLSGIPEENIYNTYNNGEITSNTVSGDHSTDQQVEALNWFNEIADKNGWTNDTRITISGHSKGGNKAQFVTMNSDLVHACYSFDGQGFSPEALDAMKEKCGGYEYEKRRQKIMSFSAENDYVNVLGKRLVPRDHIYYFEAPIGDEDPMAYHFMEAMLDENGRFNAQCEQGELSQYIERASDELMEMDPSVRQYATMGVMNVCQKTLGKGVIPVNGDSVSEGDTFVGTGIAVAVAGVELLGTKDGHEALGEIVKLYGDEISDEVKEFYRGIGKKYGPFAEAGAVVFSVAAVTFAAPFIIKTAVKAVGVSWAVNAAAALYGHLKTVSEEIYTRLTKFYNSTVGALKEWYNKNLNSGYRYASANSYIRINTREMRVYADRLRKVNRRLADLDRRLDSLYTKVGLKDIWSLLQADALTGYSWRLNRCINYLDDTAEEFERAEYSVTAQE